MKFNLKKIIIFIFIFTLAHTAQAQILEEPAYKAINENTDVLGYGAGINTQASVGVVLATVIKAFLSVMGIVFLIILLMAGWKMMMANGEEKAVTEAKNNIKIAVIGLALMVGAYAITAFVFQQLDNIPF